MTSDKMRGRFASLSMDSDRWQRVEHLYHLALASPPGRREAVLEESCANDSDLRREVESLLEARDEAGSFLSPDDLGAHVADLAAAQEAPQAGGTLGPYQLLSLLGAGGMGEVYRARDTRLNRQVALKLLPADFTHDSGRRARFLQEAQTA